MTPAGTKPLALIAELTHRCPLHCVYCSNPLELKARSEELSTEAWARVFREAGAAGVLQTDLTGGEPLARPDLAELIRAARDSGLYVSLITSGLPLDEERLGILVQAGLDHIQLSFQGPAEDLANEIAGTKAHAQKLRVLTWIQKHRIALTLNFVIHRRNIHQLEQMVTLAESSAATRVEFAHVQYYGWAFRNRHNLLPTREQLYESLELIKKAQDKLRGKIQIEYVVPDYYAKYPKACMGGWGRKLILVAPNGDVLPCHAAAVIPGIHFENVKGRSLVDIWEQSEAFQRFRGEAWLPEPCRSCDRREQDFGGCRCQAMLLAGNPSATDPVCSLAPDRPIVDAILGEVNSGKQEFLTKPQWSYRANPS